MAAVVELDPDGTCKDLRMVAGAVAVVPQEVESAEAWARGKRLAGGLVGEIAEGYSAAISPISDLRGSEWYRKQLIRVLARRAIEEAVANV